MGDRIEDSSDFSSFNAFQWRQPSLWDHYHLCSCYNATKADSIVKLQVVMK